MIRSPDRDPQDDQACRDVVHSTFIFCFGQNVFATFLRNSGSIEGQLDSWLCWHSSAWRATDVAEVEEPPTAIGMAQDLLGRMQDLLDEEDWTGAS